MLKLGHHDRAMRFSTLPPFQQCLLADTHSLGYVVLIIAVWADWISGMTGLILFPIFTSLMRGQKSVIEGASEQLTHPQKRVRFTYYCVLDAGIAGFLLYAIPFGLGTPEFWCIYLLALTTLGVLLHIASDDIFHAA